MANIIALIIFIGSFCGIAFLVFKKLSILASLPAEPIENQKTEKSRQIKKDILQKTGAIKQAILRNKKAQAIMAKAGGIKTIFASSKMTAEEIEKVAKIHKEGDYWQKVEQHKFPSKKKEVEPQPKKPRVRKKKTE